jgi:hypothetical protein
MLNLSDTLAALRPLESTHMTTRGECVGFFMVEATRALGGLSQASNAIAVLMAEGLVDSKHVVIGDDVHTLYLITDASFTTTSATVH